MTAKEQAIAKATEEMEIRSILEGLDEVVLEPEDMHDAINRAWLKAKVSFVESVYRPSPLWERLHAK